LLRELRDLINGFQVTIHILVRYRTRIGSKNLLGIDQRVKSVTYTFAEKNAKVKVEYEFRYEAPLSSARRSYPAMWRTFRVEKVEFKQGIEISASEVLFFWASQCISEYRGKTLKGCWWLIP
jgi:hypothetical protein